MSHRVYLFQVRDKFEHNPMDVGSYNCIQQSSKDSSAVY